MFLNLFYRFPIKRIRSYDHVDYKTEFWIVEEEEPGELQIYYSH